MTFTDYRVAHGELYKAGAFQRAFPISIECQWCLLKFKYTKCGTNRFRSPSHTTQQEKIGIRNGHLKCHPKSQKTQTHFTTSLFAWLAIRSAGVCMSDGVRVCLPMHILFQVKSAYILPVDLQLEWKRTHLTVYQIILMPHANCIDFY